MPDQVEPPPVLGAKFSLRYLQRSEAQPDNPKFRRRVGVYYYQHFADDRDGLSGIHRSIVETANREIGLSVIWYDERPFIGLFKDLPVHELMDLIGIISERLFSYNNSGATLTNTKLHSRPPRFRSWIAFVERCFREENMNYRLDEAGSVHYFVDQAFQSSISYAIQTLSDDYFSAVRKCIEDASDALSGIEPRPTDAVRKTFEALEILVKIVFPESRVSRLNDDAIRISVLPRLKELYGSSSTEAATMVLKHSKMMEEWGAGIQPFRHGSKNTEYKEIPLRMAVSLVDTGISFVRLLASLRQVSPDAPGS